MSKTRRLATIVATVAAGLAPVATGTPAAASGGGPHPLMSWVQAVEAHEPTWVDIYWRTGRKICDAQVQVAGRKVDVGYPSNTGAYTSFSRDDSLRSGELDRTAVNVTAHYGRSAFVPLEATMTYTNCVSDEVKVKSFPLTLPVLS
ncbi:hypothetical protein AB0M36_15715 [Actinoplanes sp. NPDC051346]|uniref:hypothetical protein n=1 Tax=Actinoplanes sp. NPDC051346 TaxID=3155048 RepID=UPI003414617D